MTWTSFFRPGILKQRMVLSQLSSPWMDGTLFLSMGVKKYEGRLLSIRRASQAAVLLLVSESS